MTAAEIDLWRRWKAQRDRDAFERLVVANQGFVHDFARRVCGHDADAEDIAQDAFLELAEAPLDRPIEVGLRAFLGRRVVLAAKTLKRAALSRRAKEAEAPPPRISVAGLRPETEEALALLDEDERQAVVLRFLHGLSYAEVALVLGVSEGAARVRVHRALGRLRDRLGAGAESALAALPLFLPAKTFSRAAAEAAAEGGLLMAASANRYLVVALVLLLVAAGGLVGTKLLSTRATTRAPMTSSEHAPGTADTAVASGSSSPEQRDASGEDARTADAPPADPGQPGGTPRLSARVRFTDGTPWRGARFRIEAQIDDVTTDEEGRFVFDGRVFPGLDKLCHMGPDGYQLCIARIPTDATDFEVVVEPGVALGGSVHLERSGLPVAGAMLEMKRPGSAAGGLIQAAWGKARSDAEGRFAFEHLLPATYEITLTAKGIEPQKVSVAVSAGSPPLALVVRPARDMTVRFAGLPSAMIGRKVTLGVLAKGAEPITLWYWDVEIDANGEVQVEAPPPGRYGISVHAPRGEPTTPVGYKQSEFESVEGVPVLVVFASEAAARVEGTLQLPDGSPAADRFLRLERSQLYARTDAGGRFAFDPVPAGDETLVLHEGMTQLPIAKLAVPAQGAVRRDVRLVGTGSIVGRFPSAKGEINAHVSLRKRSDRAPVAHASFGIGGDGSFRIPFVEAGDYELVVYVLRKGSARRELTVANDTVDVGDLAIDPTPEVPVVAAVPPGAKVAGEVQVRAQGPDGDAYGWLALDDQGMGFLRGLRPGRYRISFTAPGCAPVEADVEVEAAPSRAIALTLLPK